jgi:hypothetical protein
MQMRGQKLDDGLTFTVYSPKDYGHEHPQPSFLDKHGEGIGFILCTLSSVAVIGFMVWAIMLPLTELIVRMAAKN